VAVKSLLAYGDHALHLRHGCEQRYGDGSTGNGEARVGMRAGEIIEESRRQHDIADARLGDEEDTQDYAALAGSVATNASNSSAAAAHVRRRAGFFAAS